MADENDDLDTDLDGVDREDDDENEKSDEETEYAPPTEEEWRRTQAALAKANGEAKKHRLKVRELTKNNPGDDKAREASEAAEKRFKPIAIRSAAKAALLEAGLNDASPERVKKLLRMVDMDEVDVDDDGDVTGLEVQIETIKEDYPELFKAPEQQRRRTTRLDASGRDGGGTKSKSSAELIAAQLTGGR